MIFDSSIIKNLRTLSPAGNFLPIGPIFFNTLFKSKENLLSGINSTFQEHEVFVLNSGKAAIVLILESLKTIDKRRTVLVSAYTCPDVAVSALKAGFKVRLLDTEPNSSKVKLPTNDDLLDCAAFISSNLYGEADSSEIEKICLHNKILHIDDACQSAHIFKNEATIGRSINSTGIFSFGRGKAYSGAGGGMLSIPKSENFSLLLNKVNENHSLLQEANIFYNIKYLLKLLILNILKNPYLYGIVNKMKFLKLGETLIDFRVDIRKASKAELALINFALSDDNKHKSFSRKVLIVKKEKKVELFKQILAKKLGISSSYPQILIEYEELKDVLYEENKDRVLENARLLSQTVITIPTHDLVTVEDNREIQKLIFNN